MRIAPELGSESGEADCERRSRPIEAGAVEAGQREVGRIEAGRAEFGGVGGEPVGAADLFAMRVARTRGTEDGALRLRISGGRRGDK